MNHRRLAELIATLAISDEIWLSPIRLASPDAWAGHFPFAGWLMKVQRPRVFVELGTHSGNSYSAFCRAVAAQNPKIRCFAVDTWEGDPHAGSYGEEVFAEWNAFHERHWSSFSTLLRMTFDQALESFEDKSIDLLHIDGLHTYEAVRHDFESWLPKLSDRAVVVLHDTQERGRDFGVWRYWAELAARYPSFEFAHSHGLGVVAVGSDIPDELRALFEAATDGVTRELVRGVFRAQHEGFLAGIGDRDVVLAKDRVEIEALQQAYAASQKEIRDLREGAVASADSAAGSSHAAAAAAEELARLRARTDDMLRSTSWRLTAPLRATVNAARTARYILLPSARSHDPNGPPREIVRERNRRLREEALLRTVGPLTVARSNAVNRLRRSVSRARIPAAMIVHAYYPELAPEILACHANLPPGSPLLVTTPEEKVDAAREAFASANNCQIWPVPNRGRDIAPFFTVLNSGALDPYDAVLKLHTKKSPHIKSGDVRRKLLFGGLAGNGRLVTQILGHFESPEIGMCGWGRSWRTGGFYWMDNRDHIETISESLDLAAPESLAFFEGSMFWFRPRAFARFKRVGFEPTAFEAEAGQTDGCLHHALERLFGPVCAADGYDTVDEKGSRLLSGSRVLSLQPLLEVV